MCSDTCTPATCNNDTWHSNHNSTNVFVGNRLRSYNCSPVTWISPGLLKCKLGPGQGRNLNVIVQVSFRGSRGRRAHTLPEH